MSNFEEDEDEYFLEQELRIVGEALCHSIREEKKTRRANQGKEGDERDEDDDEHEEEDEQDEDEDREGAAAWALTTRARLVRHPEWVRLEQLLADGVNADLLYRTLHRYWNSSNWRWANDDEYMFSAMDKCTVHVHRHKAQETRKEGDVK